MPGKRERARRKGRECMRSGRENDQFATHKKGQRLKKAGGLTVRTIRMMAAVNDAGRVIGEDHANARYLDSDVANVIELRRQGYTYREISRMMDMPIRTLRDYLSGRLRCQSVAGWKAVIRDA